MEYKKLKRLLMELTRIIEHTYDNPVRKIGVAFIFVVLIPCLAVATQKSTQLTASLDSVTGLNCYSDIIEEPKYILRDTTMSYKIGFLRELSAAIPVDTNKNYVPVTKFLIDFVVDSMGTLRDVRWINKPKHVADTYEQVLLQRLRN